MTGNSFFGQTEFTFEFGAGFYEHSNIRQVTLYSTDNTLVFSVPDTLVFNVPDTLVFSV